MSIPRVIVLGTVAYADMPVDVRIFQTVQNGTATEVKVIVDPRQVEQWAARTVEFSPPVAKGKLTQFPGVPKEELL